MPNIFHCIKDEVNSAIETIMELRAEVDRQKTVMAELETQRQGIVAERTALSEISQNTQQLQRNAARAEEKLAQLRKQAQVRFLFLAFVVAPS